MIQPKAKHLILGTHGRSLYKANIAPLQLITSEFEMKKTHVFAIQNIRKRSNWGSSWSKWLQPNTPKISIPYFSNQEKKHIIEIYLDDVKVNSFAINSDKGFNEASFDVSFSKKGRKEYLNKNKDASSEVGKNGVFYLPKGKYIVKIDGAQGKFSIK